MHGHTHHHPNPRDARYHEVRKVTLIGSVVDLLLGVIKVVVGYLAHSQALVADGIHSFSDLLTDFLVLFAAKHAHREADEEHPYGHGRIETVATVALGVALLTLRFLQLAWQIFTGEVDQIIASHEAEELMEELEMEAPHPLPDLDNRTGREG